MALPSLLCAHDLAKYLKSHDSILLIDLSDTEQYRQAHLPDAVHIPPQALSGASPTPGFLPDASLFADVLASRGYQDNLNIVVYDNAGHSVSGRFVWIMDSLGHTNVSVLNGGLSAWHAAGLPVTQAIPNKTKSSPHITWNQSVTVSMDQLIQWVKNPDDNTVIWDARSLAEYEGHKVMAKHRGHIPHAVHLEWLALLDHQGHILPKDRLQSLLDQHGITADKRIITHCQTHRRSGLTYLVAKKVLRFSDVFAYAGSWSEWGNSDHTPIAQ